MEFLNKGFVEETLLPDGPTTGTGGVQANFEDRAIGAMVGGMGRAQDGTLATAKIRALEFSVLRNNDVIRMSHCQVLLLHSSVQCYLSHSLTHSLTHPYQNNEPLEWID
jgi:hypothetical protein